MSRKSFINESDECFLNKFFFIFTVLGAIAYWLFGYAFAFGADGNGFIGHEYFALSYLPSGTFSHWFFHFVFAATAATIVSGAMAERTEFMAYLVYSVFLTGQLWSCYYTCEPIHSLKISVYWSVYYEEHNKGKTLVLVSRRDV